MASKIIDSQIGFSRKFAESGQQVVDLLKPKRHNSSAPGSIRPRYITVTNAALDSNVTIDIPNDAYLGDLYASFQLPAADNSPTDSYCDYVGLNIIKTVKLTHGGNTIHEYDYRTVMSSILSGLDSSQHASILDAAGGAGPDDGVYIAPIPTFWSRLAYNGEYTPPLAYHLFRGDMQLELTLRNANEISTEDAATGSITSMRFHYLEYDTTTDQKRSHSNERSTYLYYGVDWVTDIGNDVASGAASIDLSGFRGGITRLSVSTVSDASLALTVLDRYVEVAHSKLVVTADGEELIKFDPQSSESAEHELEYYNFLMGHSEANATLNSASNLYFDMVGHSEAGKHFSGHLNADAINNLSLDLETGTTNATADVVAWRDSLFFYDNGQLRRQI